MARNSHDQAREAREGKALDSAKAAAHMVRGVIGVVANSPYPLDEEATASLLNGSVAGITQGHVTERTIRLGREI